MVALCAFGLLSMGMAGAVYAQKGPAAGKSPLKVIFHSKAWQPQV
jgi:hypothetical protein